MPNTSSSENQRPPVAWPPCLPCLPAEALGSALTLKMVPEATAELFMNNITWNEEILMADLIKIQVLLETTSKNLSHLLVSLNFRWMWSGLKKICPIDISQNGLSSNPSFASACEGDLGPGSSAGRRGCLAHSDSTWSLRGTIPVHSQKV